MSRASRKINPGPKKIFQPGEVILEVRDGAIVARHRFRADSRAQWLLNPVASPEEKRIALARLDAGNAPGEREPVDLALVARECLDRLQAQADQRGVRFQADLQPATLPGHADQLGRVFANLLENALDHTPAGGTVRVTTAAENDQVVAVVADTGVGIPPEALPRIFDRFYQVAQSRTGREGHFGIGLALCKAIVEAHGGRIEAASELNAGTTMTLRWPVEPAAKFLRST